MNCELCCIEKSELGGRRWESELRGLMDLDLDFLLLLLLLLTPKIRGHKVPE